MMSGFTGLQKDELAILQKGNEWTNSGSFDTLLYHDDEAQYAYLIEYYTNSIGYSPP